MAIDPQTLCMCGHVFDLHGPDRRCTCPGCGGFRPAMLRMHADPVNHPAHYGGDVPHEVIKCLSAWGLERDALLWNTVKYIARSGLKGAPLVDLKKAAFYLQHRIQEMEEKEKAGA